MNRWFLCQSEKVSGPFTTDEVKAQMVEGQLPSECLIWGRPQAQWRNLELWNQELPNLERQYQELQQQTQNNQPQAQRTQGGRQVSQATRNPVQTAAVTTIDTSNIDNHPTQGSTIGLAAAADLTTDGPAPQLWHYAVDGASRGPLLRAELISELRAIQSKDEILVWTKGMKSWADLYDFGDLLDDLGLNRREHPRAPIRGSVVLRHDDQPLLGQIKSISEGGFRVVGVDMRFSIGQVVDVEIKSDELPEVILAKASVQYLTELGYYGFKFQSLSQESKAYITDFVLKTRQSVPRVA